MIKKIVVASDSFKESMTSLEACYEMKQGLISGFQRSIEIVSIPMADGGEGICDVLIETMGAERINCEAKNAYQDTIATYYGYNSVTQTAIIESALICGLEMIPLRQRNPIHATSYGVGQVMKEALFQGAKKIIIGLGGTATNDGGLGMLTALGALFYNEHGEELIVTMENVHAISRIDLAHVQDVWKDVEVIVASDVENVYVGETGATYTYGKQKGATDEQLVVLENCLCHIQTVIEYQFGINLSEVAKTGAAGGLAGALYMIGAEFISGVDLVLQETCFTQKIQGADIIITGEGSIDHQTAYGKTISGIAQIAKQYHIPVIALAGRVTENVEALYEMGVTSVFSITNEAKSLEDALLEGKKSLRQTMENLARLLDVFHR